MIMVCREGCLLGLSAYSLFPILELTSSMLEGASEKVPNQAVAPCLQQRSFPYLPYCCLVVSVAHTLSKWLYYPYKVRITSWTVFGYPRIAASTTTAVA